jgi:hypothetical protein
LERRNSWQQSCTAEFMTENDRGYLLNPGQVMGGVRNVPDLLKQKGEKAMNIFYIIGVVVVVLFVLGYFGLR